MTEILQFTSLISAFLLLCGVIKFYIYYKQFGISILRFIEIEEILALFMDNLIAYLAIIIPTTLYIYLIRSNISISIFEKIGTYFHILFNKWQLVMSFSIISLLGVVFYKIKNKGVNYKDLILLIILILSCTAIIPIAFMLLSDLTKESKSDSFPVGVYLFLTCFLLLVYTILTALNEYSKVFHKDYYSGTLIFFKENNTKIKSNSSIFFIGMTKKYIFLYDKIHKICTVYKIENIIKIEFADKRK